MQPRCVDCGSTLAAPSPEEYLGILSLVRERILLSAAPAVRAEDVLRPYQDVVQGSIELHSANCPRNLAAAAALDGALHDDGPDVADGTHGSAVTRPFEDEGPSTPLTAREEEVLALVLAGASSKEIADRLYISAHTVAFHVKKLMRKFGVHSKVALVAKAALQLNRTDVSIARRSILESQS